MHSFLFTLVVVAAALPLSRPVRADDLPSAIDELKQGYALKQAGKCGEAIPHFVRSLQIDAKPKAALNLADCEQRQGDLLSARDHATRGRDLAQQQNDTELVGIAEQQLATIDRRLPRLIIRLSPDAPVGSVVARDGVILGTTSLGVALPLNPGTYHIVATAPGHAQHQSDVTLGEGAREDIEVQPGPAVVRARPAAIPPTTIAPTEGSTSSTRNLLTYGAFGLGGVGLVVGVGAGLAGTSKHATLNGECDTANGTCPPSAASDLDSFHTLRTVSTVGYVVGALGLVAGGVLLFALPSSAESPASTGLYVGPTSCGLAGRF